MFIASREMKFSHRTALKLVDNINRDKPLGRRCAVERLKKRRFYQWRTMVDCSNPNYPQINVRTESERRGINLPFLKKNHRPKKRDSRLVLRLNLFRSVTSGNLMAFLRPLENDEIHRYSQPVQEENLKIPSF
jgi:hypothetical protein